jgi:hypothetical protein
MAELVDGIRPLSSFGIHEQRAILALVRLEDSPPAAITAADLAEIREAARAATVTALRDALRDRDARRALPATSGKPPVK